MSCKGHLLLRQPGDRRGERRCPDLPQAQQLRRRLHGHRLRTGRRPQRQTRRN